MRLKSNLKIPTNKGKNVFHYEKSIVIKKPLPEVWEYMDDIRNNKDYQSFLRSVSKKPNGPIKVGTLLIYDFKFLWKKFTNVYQVVEYDPPYKMSFVSLKQSAIHATGSNIFKAIDESTTRLKMVFDPNPSGFFKNKSDEKIDKIYNKNLTKVVKKIKRNLEKNS